MLNFIALPKDDYCREIHKGISGITDLETYEAKYRVDCYNLLKNAIHQRYIEQKISAKNING